MESSRNIYSLSDLSRSIRSVIERSYPGAYWIKAEIAKLNLYPRSGHCYPDLVEKTGDQIVAQMRSTIWAGDYKTINKQFIDIAGRPLAEGMTILFKATVTYHAVYGFSLQIQSVEPSFTLGQMALEKQKNIERLHAEEVFGLNHAKTIALIPRRIAVVSVETSKGYHDWLQILSQHKHKFSSWHHLFPALLQGDKAVESITSQLRKIRKVSHLFDAVAIIRGGGGDVGLHCYDHFILAREVATFPIPVITGIGHATNQTITEMVAWQNKVTPTDVAYFIIGRFQEFEDRLTIAKQKLAKVAINTLHLEQQRTARTANLLTSYSMRTIKTQKIVINHLKSKLLIAADRFCKLQQKNLVHYEEKIRILSPESILKRGFSITLLKGRAINTVEDLQDGDTITTRLYSGEIESKITKIHPSHER
ncbi:MAG TPA: exodeoxyribonuclease VII large subunit [Bacteroidales bacterium]|nr:exodeoxyribonuclease VII large subunit [Bacteroidales bacterium]